MRANNSSNAFYIYDFGVNPKDAKGGKKQVQRDRRKLGTILYSNERDGQKVDRHAEMYTPEVIDAKQGVKSWFDDDLKKENIGKEYEKYLSDLAEGNVTVNMTTKKVENEDPEVQKQDTAGITGFQTTADAQDLVGGSIKKVSRKNFTLENMQDSDTVCLQFGRVTDD